METSEQILLTDDEAGKLCRVSAVTIRRWRKSAGLPHVSIGNTVRIPADDLREWIKAKAREAK